MNELVQLATVVSSQQKPPMLCAIDTGVNDIVLTSKFMGVHRNISLVK